MRSNVTLGSAVSVVLLCATIGTSVGSRAVGQNSASLDTGKAAFEGACGNCHPLGMASSTRYSDSEWTTVILRMIAFGATVKTEEIPPLAAYLAARNGARRLEGNSSSSSVGGFTVAPIQPFTVSPVQPFVETPVAPFGQLATRITVPAAPAVGQVSTPLTPDGLRLANGAIAPRTVAGLIAAAAPYPAAGEWRQWGGPDRNFISKSTGLADSWPTAGPPKLWSRPLGQGHSAIAFDDGLLFTLYRPAQTSARNNQWAPIERVIAMDASTGKTVWESEYASEPMNFSYGAGPHATPLVVENLVFTAGTNKQLRAHEKKTGRVVWSHDLVKEYGAPAALLRPPVKAGYAASPIAFRDMVIVVAGGAGQSVMAFRQRDGALVWKAGDFLVAEAAPLLIDVDGEAQLVVVGGQTINGLAPETGKILWSVPHDTDSDMNNSMPVWGPDNVLIVSSAYNQGTRAIKLKRDGNVTRAEQLWFNNRFKLMFSNAIRVGDYLYGTHGEFGPAFLAAVDVKNGQIAWQQRGFGRSSILWADGKAIVMDEDGVLKLVRVNPQAGTLLASSPLFNTTSWTAPTLVGSTLYARDREQIVALNLGRR